MTTREMVLRSWWAARRQADVHGAVTLNAASFAGFALEAAGGDVAGAQALIPAELESFWGRTRDALAQVATEEEVSRRNREVA